MDGWMKGMDGQDEKVIVRFFVCLFCCNNY